MRHKIDVNFGWMICYNSWIAYILLKIWLVVSHSWRGSSWRVSLILGVGFKNCDDLIIIWTLKLGCVVSRHVEVMYVCLFTGVIFFFILFEVLFICKEKCADERKCLWTQKVYFEVMFMKAWSFIPEVTTTKSVLYLGCEMHNISDKEVK